MGTTLQSKTPYVRRVRALLTEGGVVINTLHLHRTKHGKFIILSVREPISTTIVKVLLLGEDNTLPLPKAEVTTQHLIEKLNKRIEESDGKKE